MVLQSFVSSRFCLSASLGPVNSTIEKESMCGSFVLQSAGPSLAVISQGQM